MSGLSQVTFGIADMAAMIEAVKNADAVRKELDQLREEVNRLAERCRSNQEALATATQNTLHWEKKFESWTNDNAGFKTQVSANLDAIRAHSVAWKDALSAEAKRANERLAAVHDLLEVRKSRPRKTVKKRR